MPSRINFQARRPGECSGSGGVRVNAFRKV